MQKKQIYKVLVCLILSLIILAGGITPAEAAQSILREIYVGSWDIWLHADGVTWQHTGSPGQEKDCTFELKAPESLADYENVDYKIVSTDVTEETYKQLGGHHGLTYNKFKNNYLKYTPQEYKQIEDKTVSLTLAGFYEEIKKEWQSNNGCHKG